MASKKLLQTLDNRDNPDEVESQGPFICTRNPWLGKGYYFWDSFLELAHWWGKIGYDNNYIICETYCKEDLEKSFFDLVGNTEHLLELRNYAKILQGVYKNELITVAFVIEHIKKVSQFPYKAIRANPIGSTNRDEFLNSQRLFFSPRNAAYLELIPPIQICVTEKKYIGINNFRIIYPDTYCQGYTI